jgi:hypothetical protein
MKWLVIIDQGQSCDHFIGCGWTYEIVEGSTEEEAREAAREMLMMNDYLSAWDHAPRIDTAEMYPLSGERVKLPYQEWLKELKDVG